MIPGNGIETEFGVIRAKPNAFPFYLMIPGNGIETLEHLSF